MDQTKQRTTPPHIISLSTPFSTWTRRFLVRYGVIKTVVLFVALSVILSVLISSVVVRAFGSVLDRLGLTIAIVVPAIVAPIFSYLHLSMAMEIENLREEVRLLAITDNLTNAYNRRYLVGTAQHEIDAAHSRSQPLSLILFDIDEFKSINDSYGHLCGDAVLQKISAVSKTALRGQEVLIRYGGDEFIALLPGMDRTEALALAEWIRAAVCALLLEWNDKSVHTTISMGVTALEAGDRDLDDLFHKADKALYAAKGSGKNRVCSA